MRRRAFIVVLAVGCAGLAGGACTDQGTPLFILQNQVPSSGCTTIPNTLDSPFMPRGRIDVLAAGGYIFNPLVQNISAKPADAAAQRTIFVEGANIDLTFQDGFFSDADLAAPGLQSLIRFSTRFSGNVQPGGGLTSFSFVILPRALLREHLAPRLAPDGSQHVEVRAQIAIFGATGSGSRVESAPFYYSIDVCHNCMLVVVDSCTNLPQGYEARQGGECNQLQDVATECCVKADMSLLCPASTGQRGGAMAASGLP